MRKVITRSISFQKDVLDYIDSIAEQLDMNRSKVIDIIVRGGFEGYDAKNIEELRNIRINNRES